ncbi:MAG: helix-hairpin-helix domain-containing protein [Methylobacterium sp.]|nr:helix-hairpin-helix domain-containing protein [Methylobacterium sp.]
MQFPFFSESPTRAQQGGFLLLFLIIVGLACFLHHEPDAPNSLPPTWPNWDSVLVGVPASCILPDSFQLKPFPFNPNTVSDSALRRMGLRYKVVQTWMNYRNKGGHFYKAEQVQRLYALHDTEYRQLAPFIRIPETNTFTSKQAIKPILLNQA